MNSPKIIVPTTWTALSCMVLDESKTNTLRLEAAKTLAKLITKGKHH